MSNFYADNVSKSHGKHNLPPEVWARICKMRTRPVRLKTNVIDGYEEKVHTVIPKGLRGFIVYHPEAFVFSESDLQRLRTNPNTPVIIQGYGLLFLSYSNLEPIEPFFDMNIADYAAEASKEYACA